MIHVCLVAVQCRKKCRRTKLIWQQSSPTLSHIEFQIKANHSYCHSAGILNLFISTSQARMQGFWSLKLQLKGRDRAKIWFLFSSCSLSASLPTQWLLLLWGNTTACQSNSGQQLSSKTFKIRDGKKLYVLEKHPDKKVLFSSNCSNMGKKKHCLSLHLSYWKMKVFTQHARAMTVDFFKDNPCGVT